MLDLLLIHPGNRLSHIYQDLTENLTAIEPPLWAAMSATFVRQNGFTVDILDAEGLGLSLKALTAAAVQKKPRLIAIPIYGHQPSASTQMMPAVRMVASALKTALPGTPILIYGGHAAALPEQSLLEESVDFVSSGEGFYTLVDLLKTDRFEPALLDKVRDLYYRDSSCAVRSQNSAPLLEPLEESIPLPAWDLLPMKNYRAHNWHCFGMPSRSPYASIYTTLGCPYHCQFCCIQAPFRSGERGGGLSQKINSYRFWSPAAVLKQIDFLVQTYGIKNIKIADEMFVLNKTHIEQICDGILERNYGLNLWAYTRADTVHTDLLLKMKRAGFNWLAVGIESADTEVRKDVSKDFNQEKMKDALQAIRDSGIAVIANYIFGLPQDSFETMQATLDLAIQLNTEFVNFYCAMAYPGSRLYKESAYSSDSKTDWSPYSQFAADVSGLATEHLSSKEVVQFRDEAFIRYFRRPDYFEMIKHKFGAEAVGHVEAMLAYRLERRTR